MTIDTNEIRSRAIINAIEQNKDKNLCDRAKEIGKEIATGKPTDVLKWFGMLIDLNHAKLHGLGDEFHADREGGWGFSDYDDKFLTSLRMRHLGHIYGIRPNAGPLTVKQIEALRKAINKPFYTFQFALTNPTKAA